ncbi:MAG: fused MFS/spermidine synthase [Pirellulales bacterium]|nr:fused MFS/spermidine synthase [Pirellulales bacterium]
MSRGRWVVSCLIVFWMSLAGTAMAADPGRRCGGSSSAAPATGRKVVSSDGRAATAPARAPARVLASVQDTCGYLEVVEAGGLRLLVCDGVIQAAVPSSGVRLLPGVLIRARDYVELIPYYRTGTRNALVIGLGGGLHARALACHGIATHAVDVEPAIVPLAEEYFDFDGEVTIADGRAFLEQTQRRFDAIVLDTFQGASVPKHLYTREAFARMRDRLADGGVLAVHLVAPPQHASTAAVARTLAAVFPHTVALRNGFGDGIQHIYLLSGTLPLELSPRQRLQLRAWGFVGDEFFTVNTAGARILTDNENPLDRLCRDPAAEHRRGSLIDACTHNARGQPTF